MGSSFAAEVYTASIIRINFAPSPALGIQRESPRQQSTKCCSCCAQSSTGSRKSGCMVHSPNPARFSIYVRCPFSSRRPSFSKHRSMQVPCLTVKSTDAACTCKQPPSKKRSRALPEVSTVWVYGLFSLGAYPASAPSCCGNSRPQLLVDASTVFTAG